MKAFSDDQIAKAIERLPRNSSAEIRELLTRARSRSLASLEKACEEELSRRPIEFSSQQASDVEESAKHVSGMDLGQAVRYGFDRYRKPSSDEIRFLRWVAENPGGSYSEAIRAHGKGDLGLVIGHLVYDRYGCFRQFVEAGQDQSSVLLQKDRSGKSVRYRLRDDVQRVLLEIGII